MQTQTGSFPSDLLTQPAAARLAYFVGKVIRHPHLDTAHQALLDAIRHPTGASLIFVLGPTGVGKTTLRQRIEKHVLEANHTAMEQDPGHIPIVSVEAIAPESGSFNWKDYYTRALNVLADPLLGDKFDYESYGIRPNSAGHPVVKRGAVAPELRRAVERAMFYRRPLAFLVDEAQHIKKVASGRRLLDQMDTLKSLAETTRTVHVLLGTYELLDLINLSAQLGRRSTEIHLPRYRFEHSAERTMFQTILRTFQRALPLLEEPDLVQRDHYFYERSVGCVGILKNWLTRSLAAALETNQPTLTLALLDRYAEPTAKLLQMARELKDGEDALMEKQGQRAQVCALLGIPPEQPSDNESVSSPPSMTRSQHRRPGQRKPERDLVEGGLHGS